MAIRASNRDALILQIGPICLSPHSSTIHISSVSFQNARTEAREVQIVGTKLYEHTAAIRKETKIKNLSSRSPFILEFQREDSISKGKHLITFYQRKERNLGMVNKIHQNTCSRMNIRPDSITSIFI